MPLIPGPGWCVVPLRVCRPGTDQPCRVSINVLNNRGFRDRGREASSCIRPRPPFAVSYYTFTVYELPVCCPFPPCCCHACTGNPLGALLGWNGNGLRARLPALLYRARPCLVYPPFPPFPLLHPCDGPAAPAARSFSCSSLHELNGLDLG